MSLPAISAEYAAALAELGAAALAEREAREAILAPKAAAQAAGEADSPARGLPDPWFALREVELRARAAWRAASVRVVQATDRLAIAAAGLPRIAVAGVCGPCGARLEPAKRKPAKRKPKR